MTEDRQPVGEANEPKKAKRKRPAIAIAMAVLVAFISVVAYNAATERQRLLYEDVNYAQARERYLADKADYGKNDLLDAYQDKLNGLYELESDYREGGFKLTDARVSSAKKELEGARADYIDEAESIARREEEERQRQEEESARREEAERLAREQQAAKEAEDQRKREEAEASYVDPPVLAGGWYDNILLDLAELDLADIKEYYGRTGWKAYFDARNAISDYYSVYVEDYVHDRDTTQSMRELNDALEQVRVKRREMVIAQAVDDSYEYVEPEPYDPNDPYVYVTETGHRYHSKEDCTGLNNADYTFVMNRSEAIAEGYTKCQRCHN